MFYVVIAMTFNSDIVIIENIEIFLFYRLPFQLLKFIWVISDVSLCDLATAFIISTHAITKSSAILFKHTVKSPYSGHPF